MAHRTVSSVMFSVSSRYFCAALQDGRSVENGSGSAVGSPVTGVWTIVTTRPRCRFSTYAVVTHPQVPFVHVVL